MKLIAVSRVKNERDIIEPFVRHHSKVFNQLIVVDDGSSDGTYEILETLRAEGLPLVLIRDPAVGYEQGRYMTRLLHIAVRRHAADWVMPLDADEFVEAKAGQSLAQILAAQKPRVLKLAWHGFVWRPADDASSEVNPVVRLRHRMPPSPHALCKVLVPASLVTDGVHLAQGNHELFRDDRPVSGQPLDSVRLCHFPIRSVEQYAGKIAVGCLQYAATPGWNRRAGFHYLEPYRALTESLERFTDMMSVNSRRYSFDPRWPDPGEPSEAPLDYQGGLLVLTRAPASALSNALRCAETIAGKLVASVRQIETAQHALFAAKDFTRGERERIIAQEADARPVVHDLPRSSGARARHNFQSFWSGGTLGPYESFCLKSFIDCGHAFDLYSFEPDIAVPVGVRLRDARELFSPDEFFVYQDGFGKGSPAAFANLFRCKLLAKRGGWWVDTDVVCLARDIPAFGEFIAWEDARLINNAVLYFTPGDPMITACLAEAQRRGRTVRWGDTGPMLTTRIATELGYAHRAFDSGVCYPVHYSEAIDVLRPGRAESLRQRTADSLFVHLWNAMLQHRGVDKTMLPPKGSIVRAWIDRHPVEGWAGEYSEETLERGLRPDSEPRTRLSADLASGIEDIGRSDALLREMNSALRVQHAELQDRSAALDLELGHATRREEQIRAERETYRAEAEMLRNSTSWKLTAPLRRGLNWLRNGRRTGPPEA